MPAKTLASPSGAHPVKQARSRELRDALIVNARRVSEEKGFDNAAISDIAKAAGCPTGAVHYRFKDKEALFDAIVDLAMTGALARLTDRAAEHRYDGTDAEAMIRTCLHDHVEFVHQSGPLIRVLYDRNLSEPRYWGCVRTTTKRMVDTWQARHPECRGPPEGPRLQKQAGRCHAVRLGRAGLFGADPDPGARHVPGRNPRLAVRDGAAFPDGGRNPPADCPFAERRTSAMILPLSGIRVLDLGCALDGADAKRPGGHGDQGRTPRHGR